MAASKATDATLVSVGSHSVSLEYASGSEVTREECYPEITATWRGEEVKITMEANRYVHSSGWSEWRVFVHRTDPGVTDTARAALREACEPIVREWLDSDEYTASRERAFFWMIRRQVQDERYNAGRPVQTLTAHRHELTDDDAAQLEAAATYLGRFLLALEV
jgi:hypothetical protein